MARFYHPYAIPQSSLILHLDANDTDSYPGSGTTWYDLSPQGNNAIMANDGGTNPVFLADDGNGRKCFRFTRTHHGYFITNNNSPLPTTTPNFPITVIAVVTEASTDNYAGIVSQNYSDGLDSMAFISWAGYFGVDHWSPGGRRRTQQHSLNTLYTVAWRTPDWQYHQTNMQIFVDGVEQSTNSISFDAEAGVGPIPATRFIIGNWQPNRNDMDWDGNIYKVLIYNAALTDDQIVRIQNNIAEQLRL